MELVATLAVVVSVLVLAYQGRELARHTRVANEVAGTEAHREILPTGSRSWMRFWITQTCTLTTSVRQLPTRQPASASD